MKDKLVIKNLNKTFNAGTNNQNQVIKDLNLTLHQGDFLTVIGSNGAGKSTLMNLIAGNLAPDNGDITLNAKSIVGIPVHKRAALISRVFQDPKLGTAENLMIEENLAVAYYLGKGAIFKRGVNKNLRERFKELLKTLDMGLEARLQTAVSNLSGGQRQALALLMAILKNPEILLLDEHTAALDPRMSQKILMLTQDFVSKSQITTLMVTHNMNDAINYGNRLIMLHKGHIAVDVSGEQKQNLTVDKLTNLFKKSVGESLADDELIL